MATVPSDPDRVSVPGAVRPKRLIGAAALTLAVLLLGLAATSIAALGRRDQLDGEYESRYGLARLEAVGDLSAGVERYATVLRSAGAFITLSEERHARRVLTLWAHPRPARELPGLGGRDVHHAGRVGGP